MESLHEPESEPDNEPVLPQVVGFIVVEVVLKLTPTERDDFIDGLV